MKNLLICLILCSILSVLSFNCASISSLVPTNLPSDPPTVDIFNDGIAVNGLAEIIAGISTIREANIIFENTDNWFFYKPLEWWCASDRYLIVKLENDKNLVQTVEVRCYVQDYPKEYMDNLIKNSLLFPWIETGYIQTEKETFFIKINNSENISPPAPATTDDKRI